MYSRISFSQFLAALMVVAMSGLALTAHAQDLSDDINNPTIFTIGSGNTSVSIVNSVFESDLSTGVTGNTTGDIDFFNIDVQGGYQLDSIFLDSFDGGGLAFFGFAENTLGGNPALAAEQDAFVATALGFSLIDGSETSLFADLAAGAGVTPGIGFDPSQSLGAGTYAFVFQNTGGNVNNYGLTFSGSAVPEPTSALVLCVLGLAATRRQR